MLRFYPFENMVIDRKTNQPVARFSTDIEVQNIQLAIATANELNFKDMLHNGIEWLHENCSIKRFARAFTRASKVRYSTACG